MRKILKGALFSSQRVEELRQMGRTDGPCNWNKHNLWEKVADGFRKADPGGQRSLAFSEEMDKDD